MSGGGVGLRGRRRLVRAPSVGPSPWEHVVEAHYGLNAETQMLWQEGQLAELACLLASVLQAARYKNRGMAWWEYYKSQFPAKLGFLVEPASESRI